MIMTEKNKELTKMFTKEFLLEEVLWGCSDKYKIVEDIETEHSHWSQHHCLTFEFEDQLWQTSYSRGLSETQEEYPFEHAPDEVECYLVEKVETTKVVVTYEQVKQDAS